MEEMNNIARQNSDRLAALSIIFCLMNNLPMDDTTLCKILSMTVMSHIAKWYEDRGKTFNPEAELIEDEAIKSAFERVQEIANLAAISAQTGIGMEGFGLNS